MSGRSLSGVEALLPDRARHRLFLIALERGFLDSALDRLVVDPFTAAARRLTRLDTWLCGAVLPARDRVPSRAPEDRDE